jgi:serine/threonine-protein phosphatase 2A regulatory subunit A
MSATSILPAPSIQLARSLHALTVEEVSSMSAYSLFQKQLESGSAEAANDAMKRLSVVAVTLGIPETRDSLLPYLTVLVQGQPTPPDELLLLMGQELVKVVSFCGQSTPAEHFVPILERLAAVEETVVRDQAVIVMEHVTKQASPGDAPLFIALLKRLATADWFTPKVSAAGFAPAVLSLPGIPDNAVSEILSTVFKDLCLDETPMVRRAAAKNWGKVVNAVGVEYKDSFAAATLPKLATDEQDSVRRLAVASLGDVGLAYGAAEPAWTAQHWLPYIKDGSTDLSW